MRIRSRELGAGFVGAALLAGEFGFGGDEFSFAGGFEDGGAVAFEVGLHAPQPATPASSRVNCFSISATIRRCSSAVEGIA